MKQVQKKSATKKTRLDTNPPTGRLIAGFEPLRDNEQTKLDVRVIASSNGPRLDVRFATKYGGKEYHTSKGFDISRAEAKRFFSQRKDILKALRATETKKEPEPKSDDIETDEN